MLDELAKIYERFENLVAVNYTLFEGDRSFVTGIEFCFDSFTFHIRAVPDDDTLSISLTPLRPDEDESLVDMSDSEPWARCIGGLIGWIWRLTNHQGYDDGLRLEINKPDEKLSTTIEFIVMASAVKIFTPNKLLAF